jgi:hypothetical protein
MKLRPNDYPMKQDDLNAFLYGAVFSFEGGEEWSLYEEMPPPNSHGPVAESNSPPKPLDADNS